LSLAAPAYYVYVYVILHRWLYKGKEALYYRCLSLSVPAKYGRPIVRAYSTPFAFPNFSAF